MKRRIRLRNSECESSEVSKQGLLSPDRLPRNASAPHMVVMGRNTSTVFTPIARSALKLSHQLSITDFSIILESNLRWDIQLVQEKIFRYTD